MTDNNIAAAIEAGQVHGMPQKLDDAGRFVAITTPTDAGTKVHDLEQLAAAYADRPRRKTGTVKVQDAASFVAYLEKHALPESEVFADPRTYQLVAVINAHQGVLDDGQGIVREDSAGHGDHRLVLDLVQTPAWKTWLALDRQWQTQAEFAEHIEDNALDVISPDAATMLELAQSFQAASSVNFKRGERLHSGVVSLHFEETQSATAGQAGDIEIPTTFTVQLAPFEGGDLTSVTARFRYRIRSGELSMSYALVQPHDVARAAYDRIVNDVAGAIDAPVLYGTPA